jgi:hypothetical protein
MTNRADRNRQNAQASTGPTSEAGKAASSQNARTHGLTAARWPILPDEQDAYAAHHAALMAEAAPDGPLETALAERVALLLWRLSRCAHLEAGLLAWHQYDALAQHAHAEQTGDDVLLLALAYSQRNPDPAAFAAARDVEAEARNRQSLSWPALGHGFAVDPAAFATLSRYEVGIEAALWRTLAQLRQLQAARCETKPAAPDGPDVSPLPVAG